MHAHLVVRTAMRAPLRTVGASWLSLLASLLTLMFCAMPIMSGTLGFGNGFTLADALDALSVTPIMAAHKQAIFVASGGLLLAAAWAVWRVDARHCPCDPEQARQYRRLRHWNRWVLKASAALWVIAITVAYIVPLHGA